jgi:hypothetical protein
MLWIWATLCFAITPEQQAEEREMVARLLLWHPSGSPAPVASEGPAGGAEFDAIVSEDEDLGRYFGRLKRYLATFRDGHLDAVMDGAPLEAFLSHPSFIPLDVLPYGDELYFDPRLHSRRGRIVSINGTPGPEILKRLRGTVSVDGAALHRGDDRINHYFANMYAQVFGFSDQYVVLVEENSKLEENWTGVSHDQVPYIGDADTVSAVWEEATLIVSLSEMMPGKRWEAVGKEVRKAQRVAKGVILDLRRCGGGHGPTSNEVFLWFAYPTTPRHMEYRVSDAFMSSRPDDSPFRFIYTPSTDGMWDVSPRFESEIEVFTPDIPRKAYRGDLVVLVGPETFSACAEVASVLQTRPNTTFLGEETRGGSELLHGGHFESATLPYSQIFVQTPVVRMVMPDGIGLADRGVIPDRLLERRPDTTEDEALTCAKQTLAKKPCVERPIPPWVVTE